MKRMWLAGLGATGLLLSACPATTEASTDVRGNYTLSFDDTLTITLRVGGAVLEAQGSESDTVTFDFQGQPVQLDLSAFCAREEVKCPSEVLWTEVSVDQPLIPIARLNAKVINVINNTNRNLAPGEQAEVVAGLLDDRDRFGLLIEADSASQGDCGLLAISSAGGRFSHDGETVEVVTNGSDVGDADIEGAPQTRLVWPEGAGVNGIAEGHIKLSFLGACAFNDAALVGATLEVSTGFSGALNGPFFPPNYVPLNPDNVDEGLPLPDGGVIIDDAGVAGDGGSTDAGGEDDAGSTDAGSVDAGASTDAGPAADGGAADAGAVSDAG